MKKTMSETPNYAQKKDRNEMFRFVPFGICILLVLVLLYISGMSPVKMGEFADSDCYMHLIRVTDLYNTGRWYDPVIFKANAPYGHSMHWSKPFDILLLIGAVPMTLLTDFETALFWWAVVVSAILLVASFIAIPWATEPVLRDKDGPFLAGFVFIVQLSVLSLCQAGRPDHHSLLLFIFLLSIGFTLRMIQRPYKAFICYLAGAVSGLAMWVSLESIVPTCTITGILGLLWVLKNDDFSAKSLHYCIALLVVMGLSILIEKPWNSITILEYDRTSMVHWSIFSFVTVFWVIILMFGRYTGLFKRVICRLGFAVVGAAAIAVAPIFCFPKFYGEPYPDMDPRVFSIFFSKVDEIRPLLSKSGSLAIAVQLIGPAVVCIPFLVYQLFRKDRDQERQVWIYVSLSFAIFLLTSLYQAQWSFYLQILLCIPMASLMVLMRQWGPKMGVWRKLKNNLILLVFCAVPLILGLLTSRTIRRGDSTGSWQDISIVKLCKYLNEEGKQREQSFRILTHIDFGPEILYRTQHEVIATPYHIRNGQGMLDTYDIMMANTDDEALKIIQKRGIDSIVLCPRSSESSLYSKIGDATTFYQRLCDGVVPIWLRKVELPSDLASSFLLFKTIEEKQIIHAKTS